MLENRISRQLEDYLNYKHSLGFKLKHETGVLKNFAQYTLDIDYDGPLSLDIILSWVSLGKQKDKTMGRRIKVIIPFSKYVASIDPEADMIHGLIYKNVHERPTPYIFTELETIKLMNECRKLYSPDGIRAYSVEIIIGLLWTTGLRPSEPTNLTINDVDFEQGIIHIKETKFSKERYIPLDNSVTKKLKEYHEWIKQKVGVTSLNAPFFYTTGGKPLKENSLSYAFKLIRPCINAKPKGYPYVRLYDFRHTKASNIIKYWYKQNIDIHSNLYVLSTYLGHVRLSDTYWYLSATPELLEMCCTNMKLCLEVMLMKYNIPSFQILLQNYFIKRMMQQRQISPETINSYKDTFQIYILYLFEVHKISSSKVSMEHFKIDYIEGFCQYLKVSSNNKATTINNRIAALKSFMKYVLEMDPEYSYIAKHVLMLPMQKCEIPTLDYIDKNEFEAMLKTCNTNTFTFIGSRDKLMLLVLYNTGVRVSELLAIKCSHLQNLDTARNINIHIYGKGRKTRIVPLWKTTSSNIKNYIKFNQLKDNNLLFLNKNGSNLTRSGVRSRIDVIVNKSIKYSPSLTEKKISPHTFRHSVAMNLLAAGVDISTIAIWLGHASIETTHKYMISDIKIKRKAMEKVGVIKTDTYKYKPSNDILKFLNSL